MPEQNTHPRKMKLQPNTGITFRENGDVLLRCISMPDTAVTVTVGNDDRTAIQLPMEYDDGPGCFSAVLPAGTMQGPQKVVFRINGTPTLNVAAPMWYYANQLNNYVELPDPETDALIAARRDVPHGEIRHEFIWSDAFGEFVNTLVYTPPGYDAGTAYPVLTLFHEVAENQTAWTDASKLNFLLDNLIAEGKIAPFLLVEVDATVRLNYREYADWYENYGPVEDFVTRDCIAFMEQKYNVRKDKWGRAIGGFGLGAVQAGYIGLRHPELFGSLGLFTAFWPSVKFHQEGKYDPFYEAAEKLSAHPEELDIFFHAEGELDPHFAGIYGENAALKELGFTDLPGYVFKTYRQTHNWGSYRRAMRDFAPLLFRKG